MADFYKRVAKVCSLIPAGSVASYGQIALLCEKPQNSRQVGYALGRKLTEVAEAHRIVNQQGHLSGASAFEQPDLQKLLLEDEGVEVAYVIAIQKYKVNMKRYQWKHTLDDVRLLKAYFHKEKI